MTILKPNDDQFDDLFKLVSPLVHPSYLSKVVSDKNKEFLWKAGAIFKVSEKLSSLYSWVDKLEYILITCGADGIRLISRSKIKI